MRRLWPTTGCLATTKRNNYKTTVNVKPIITPAQHYSLLFELHSMVTTGFGHSVWSS